MLKVLNIKIIWDSKKKEKINDGALKEDENEDKKKKRTTVFLPQEQLNQTLKVLKNKYKYLYLFWSTFNADSRYGY